MPDINTLMAFEAGELDEEEVIAFIQHGIDNDWVWHLQGSYGRLAASLLASGDCLPRSR